MEPYSAIIIGCVGGLLSSLFSQLLLKLQIDDPLDASSIHLVGGMWSLISVGLFADKFNVGDTYGSRLRNEGA